MVKGQELKETQEAKDFEVFPTVQAQESEHEHNPGHAGEQTEGEGRLLEITEQKHQQPYGQWIQRKKCKLRFHTGLRCLHRVTMFGNDGIPGTVISVENIQPMGVGSPINTQQQINSLQNEEHQNGSGNQSRQR